MDHDRLGGIGGTTSRYLTVSRRSVLAGLALAAGGGLGACSTDDEEVFVGATDTTGATPEASSAAADAGASTAVDDGAAAADGTVPAGAAMRIDFTFTAGSSEGGPARNPYVAVWVETPDEQMVTTIALWHLQVNERWLGELKRWYAKAEGQGESVSSATRVPGDFSLEWDCTDAGGAKVAAGEYYLCIEGAREHGPYELIRESITLGDAPVEQTLTPSGELTAASATYTV